MQNYADNADEYVPLTVENWYLVTVDILSFFEFKLGTYSFLYEKYFYSITIMEINCVNQLEITNDVKGVLLRLITL